MEKEFIGNIGNKKSIELDKLVKHEYRTYQLYTLMDRAIPYLQDGLKPSQRRILYTLWKFRSKGLQKVSAATGLVLTLHPHGPASIESAIVNMAQNYTFSNNYPLIEKKGYFGERMETSPAAGRYIECKLSKLTEFLLFDDMNQVVMQPNYDEKTDEPLFLLPKLPIMLLNGAEGIGTGFSTSIPSFHHKDLCNAMIQYLTEGKIKNIKAKFLNYNTKPIFENKKIIFNMAFEERNNKFYITEIPRGYDAKKLYKFLNKYIESGFLKDYIDSSVNNTIVVELLFKRSSNMTLAEIQRTMKVSSSLVPNYTLISERGVKVFDNATEIIALFTDIRLKVVKTRYQLLIKDLEQSISLNNEIIKFIKNKEYIVATTSDNRASFIKHLTNNKYVHSEYLADMSIYRMTKDEVKKRTLLLKEEKIKLKEYLKIYNSPKKIQEKLITEIELVKKTMNEWLKEHKKK